MVQEGARKCSHCGHNGHNSRTCNGKGRVKIFGVNLLHPKHNHHHHHHHQLEQQSDQLIKSASMGNLASLLDDNSQPRHVLDRDGYNSDGYISSNRNQTPHERRKGKPWTEEEHREFLTGLQNRGKGDWRGISKNFVVSRTPTQVASHAQKYFLRQASTDKVKKRRTSLFDKTFEDLESSPNFSSPVETRPPQVIMAPTTVNPQLVSGTLHSPCDISPKVYHYTQIMDQFPGLDLGNPLVGPALVPNSSSSNYQPYPCLGVPGITFRPSFLANRTLAPVQFHGGMAYSRPGPGYYSYSMPSKTPVSLHPSGIPTPRPIPHSYWQEHPPMPFAATRSEKADPLELKIGQAPPSSPQGANLSSQPSGAIRAVSVYLVPISEKVRTRI